MFIFLISISLEASLIDKLGGQDHLIFQNLSPEDRAHVRKVTVKENLNPDFVVGSSVDVCGDVVNPFVREQTFKEYHAELVVDFSKKTLPGTSSMCDISQGMPAKCRRVENRTQCVKDDFIKKCQKKKDPALCLNKPLRCLKAKRFKITILSDLYVDQCSQVVRGFALKAYSLHESMTDLVSPGHSLVLKEKFANSVVYGLGDTYPVERDTFFYFTEASKEVSQ